MAKGVELTNPFKSNVVVMVSIGEIGGEAQPAAIVDVFAREARHAMDLKKLGP